MPTVWLLNLDAELELAAPNGYTPSRSVLHFVERSKPRLLSLTREDRVLDNAADARVEARGFRGLAWCPTPYALKRLKRAGASLPDAPPLEVLQRVNHRAFSAQLGQPLQGAHLFEQPEELLGFVRAHLAQTWLVKRGYGFAGRGQRRTRGVLDADDERWLVDSFKYGSVQLEPFVDLQVEFAQHGFIPRQGPARFGRLCVQQSDAQRCWEASRPAAPKEFEPWVATALHEEAERCAEALSVAGYFGPFGIDAYLYRDPGGQLQLNPRSEINARYTMGYGIGMTHEGDPRDT